MDSIQFIEKFFEDKENITLLNDNQFDTLYIKFEWASSKRFGLKETSRFIHTSFLTKLLTKCNLQIIDKFEDKLPAGYLAETENLINIQIPDNIKIIGTCAFLNCLNLKNVVLSKNLKQINQNAFRGCGFTSIDFPSSLTRINYGAFEDCSNLTEIFIPKTLNVIENSVFQNCTSLECVDIEDGLCNVLGRYLFSNCVNLEKVSIPESIVYMNNFVFDNCNNLKSIHYKGSVSDWNKIIKENNWYKNSAIKQVFCFDDIINLI